MISIYKHIYILAVCLPLLGDSFVTLEDPLDYYEVTRLLHHLLEYITSCQKLSLSAISQKLLANIKHAMPHEKYLSDLRR